MRKAVRLIDQGMRPGAVFAQIGEATISPADEELVQPAGTSPDANGTTISDLAHCLLAHDPFKMRRVLERELFERGVTDFVESIAAPLMLSVGELWQHGRLNVFSEHVASCVMESVLHEANRRLSSEFASPRILLTTPPGEQHRLGMSMIRSVMSAAGAECIGLSSELPIDELCLAVKAYRPDVVGISFSLQTQPRYGVRFLRELCERIEPGTEVWAGGAGLRKMTALPPGVRVFANAHAVQCRIEEMRRQSRTSLGNRPR